MFTIETLGEYSINMQNPLIIQMNEDFRALLYIWKEEHDKPLDSIDVSELRVLRYNIIYY